MTATNKQYSYPRVAAIQIDVHPIGENLINIPHTFHARSVYGPRPYILRGGNLSLVLTRTKHALTLRRSLGNQRQIGPAVTLGHLILPPS
jgi:hypothetical protein